jgi:DNA mismatch repair protein MutH
MPISPPTSTDQLLSRADALAGRTLGELALQRGREVPEDFSRAKGWVGQLIEAALGASAGNRPVPDFEALGVELKTLPINRDGTPRETTYICRVPLSDLEGLCWEDSRVHKKLARVLWVPVSAAPDIPVAHRQVGQPLLWSPTGDLLEALRRDWREHTEAISRGFVGDITAADGQYLQIRPKAAHSGKRTWAPGRAGGQVLTKPRGYYLRRAFTTAILRRHYAW